MAVRVKTRPDPAVSDPVHTMPPEHGRSGDFSEEETQTARSLPPALSQEHAPPLLEAQPINRPILVRLDGVLAGEVSALEHLPVTLGRDKNAVITLDDKGVSRHHATIRRVGSDFEIEDLGSKNGTYVAGHRVERCPLLDGNLIHVGHRVRFRFALVEERQEELLRQLYSASTRDALTGAYNRRYFEDRIVSEIAYARRHATELSLLMVDIDKFKSINDNYGHPTGDVVLQHLANTLQRQMRTEDLFSRIGGEEFAVLLRGISLANAAHFAERLRTVAGSTPVTTGGLSIAITLSVGCAAQSELDQADGHALISLADTRLYAAKQAGRNRVVSS